MGLATGCLLAPAPPALAQSNIVPDDTLGAERTLVTPNLNGFPTEAITGGIAIAGFGLDCVGGEGGREEYRRQKSGVRRAGGRGQNSGVRRRRGKTGDRRQKTEGGRKEYRRQNTGDRTKEYKSYFPILPIFRRFPIFPTFPLFSLLPTHPLTHPLTRFPHHGSHGLGSNCRWSSLPGGGCAEWGDCRALVADAGLYLPSAIAF